MREDIFCLDSADSWRANYVADNYKGRRAERRALDPIAQQRKATVEVFRSLLREDPLLLTASLPGFEADDVVAICFLNRPPDREIHAVVAEDKDLVQVPGLWEKMQRTDGEFVFDGIRGLPKKTPGYWSPSKTLRDVLLGQLLFGDRSDSIPRLVYKKDADLVRKIRRLDSPFTSLYHEFGEIVLQNLMLLVIPCPALHFDWELKYSLAPERLLQDLDSGEYWRGVFRSPLINEFHVEREALAINNVGLRTHSSVHGESSHASIDGVAFEGAADPVDVGSDFWPDEEDPR